ARGVAAGAAAARRPRRRWRAVLPPARRGRATRRRHRAAARAVGSGVGGARDQRHAGAVACDAVPAPVEAARRTPASCAASHAIRTARRRGWLRPARSAPPAGAGRWSLVPARAPDATRRLHASAEQLLMRHGVVTRGAAVAERVRGGFAGVYPVLKAFEEAGRCRRGYFVEGLGGAQFAHPGAVDRLRGLGPADGAVHLLAATDPANPYG